MVIDNYSGTIANFFLIAAAELLRKVLMMYGRDVKRFIILVSSNDVLFFSTFRLLVMLQAHSRGFV